METTSTKTCSSTTRKDLFKGVDLDAEYGVLHSRSRLLPIFVREILMDAHKPLSKIEIVRRLDAWPYAISANRRTVARQLDTLSAYYPANICENEKGVFWTEELKTAA